MEKNVKMWKWFVGSQQYIINTKYKRKSPRWSWGPEKVYIRTRPFTIVHSCHGNKNQAWYFGLPFPAAKAIISWTVQVFQCETCSSFHEQRFFSHHFGGLSQMSCWFLRHSSLPADGSGCSLRGLLSFPLLALSLPSEHRAWRSALSDTFYLFWVLRCTSLSSFLNVGSAAVNLEGCLSDCRCLCSRREKDRKQEARSTKARGRNLITARRQGEEADTWVNSESHPADELANQR